MSITYAFARKIHTDGKKLTRRSRGFFINLDGTGSVSHAVFVVPYQNCLISATEIVGAVLGDKFKYEILDTATGTLSGYPNGSLNIFGEDVYAAKDFYRAESAYDASLFGGLQIKVTCAPADNEIRKVYINLDLHELT